MAWRAVMAEPALPAKTEAAVKKKETMAKRVMRRFLSERNGDSSGFFERVGHQKSKSIS
jgi:hypothetical protein